MTKVTLEISDEFYEFAHDRAEEDEFFGIEDYLTSLLNMALLTAVDDFDELMSLPVPLPLVIQTPKEHQIVEKVRQHQKPDCLDELEEDPGGGVRLKSGRKRGDFDDGIPF